MFKTVVSFIGKCAVEAVVYKGVKNMATICGASTMEKIGYAGGAAILSGMVAEKASAYIDKKFDEFANVIIEIDEAINRQRAKKEA